MGEPVKEVKLTGSQILGIKYLRKKQIEANQDTVQFLRLCVEEAGQNPDLPWTYVEKTQSLVLGRFPEGESGKDKVDKLPL